MSDDVTDDESTPSRFRRLPPPVDLDTTIAETPGAPAPDPNGGRDPERDFLLRYAP